MVVACIALVVALAGTGYAAIKLPAGSVGNLQLRADSVTSSKVRDGSLRPRDFAGGSIGTRGPRGPEGPPGPAGSAGVASGRLGFAARDPASLGAGAVPVSAGATDLIGLDVASGTGGYVSSSGVVSATGPSRLAANAQVVILANAPGATDVACRISLIGSTEQRVIGNYVNTHLLSGTYQPVSVSAGANIESGTYDVRVQCLTAAASVTFHRGNLMAMVAPR